MIIARLQLAPYLMAAGITESGTTAIPHPGDPKYWTSTYFIFQLPSFLPKTKKKNVPSLPAVHFAGRTSSAEVDAAATTPKASKFPEKYTDPDTNTDTSMTSSDPDISSSSYETDESTLLFLPLETTPHLGIRPAPNAGGLKT